MEGGQLVSVVVLLVVGVVIAAWQLAILMNWRGYGVGHASRSIRAGATLRKLPLYRELPPPDAEATRRFAKWAQRIVAAALMVAGVSLAVFAGSVLVREYLA